MKLYIKANSLKILKNIDTLLPNANSKAEYLLNQNSNIEYPTNIQSAKVLLEKKEKIFYSDKKLSQLVKGVYFGNSYCEHLIPPIKDIIEAREFCQKKHYNFVFVFPAISEFYIDDVKIILEFLANEVCEVVVNDIGVLEMVLEFENLKPILGINFSKVIKNAFVDVVKPLDKSKELLQRQKELLSHIEFEDKRVREFYKSLNVGRFGIENIDVDLNFLDEVPRFYVDIYYPHITISNSKACDIAGSFEDKRGYFVYKECSKFCNYASLEFKDSKILGLYQRYNSIQKINYQLELDERVYKNKKNRLVWELFL